MPEHLGQSAAWVEEFLDPPVDYDFSEEFSVTLPAHQWQLLLRASRHGVDHVTGIGQAYSEIAHAYKVARARQKRRIEVDSPPHLETPLRGQSDA